MIKKVVIFLVIFSIPILAKSKDSTLVITNDKPVSIKTSQKLNYIPLSLSLLKIKEAPINPLSTTINYKNLGIIGGVYLGIGVAVHIYQRNAWWRHEGARFRIKNDWKYALWEDKAGHFFAANLIGHILSSGLEGADFPSSTSALYGAIGAFMFQMYVEIEDGFGPRWGFSPGDAMADLLGATYYLGQYYYPVLNNFQPRVSYFPSQKFLHRKHKDGNIIDDYEGQKYWIAVRMKNILPEPIAKYWPSFLMLDVGMGVKNLNGSGGGSRQVYLALDLDPEQIPLYGQFWQFIKNTLNYLHFPMPGIRISPHGAFLVFVY